MISASTEVLDPEHLFVVEPVTGSDIPVRLMYVELLDGVYAPIGLRVPAGEGPFPLVLFASGNGGGGMRWIRNATQTMSWTQEQFLAAGYAVAWLRYRTEVDYAYDRLGRLVEDNRSSGQLFNRGPLEYEDVIAIVKHLKTLPFVAADRVGFMGMSHGGEMALKIASEYHGFAAMVSNEPAAHEFLRLKPDATAHVSAATGLLNVEKMQMRDAAYVRTRITKEIAQARMAPIATPIFVQGRDSDELQGIFRLCYELLVEMGKPAEWASYDHDAHGFIYVKRNARGVYEPDAIQRRAVGDAIGFFDKTMKR